MNATKRIVFWQEMPSIHQAPLITEVANATNVPVHVLAAGDIPERRLRQGWHRPSFGRAHLDISPNSELQRKLLTSAPEETVHIFFGIHAYAFVYSAFRKAIKTKATIGVISEAGRSYGWKGWLRLLRNRLNAKLYSRDISFILATGELGVAWYRRSGFPDKSIFPFAHFTASFTENTATSSFVGGNESDIIKLVFVGELAPHKGFDILLTALSRLVTKDWKLIIIGNGGHKDDYKELSGQLGLSDRIEWYGVLPNAKARQVISLADVLVLPSRHDGWGAVVNEALMGGVPVICSDACGASDLIRHPFLGEVFSSGSVASLEKALDRVLREGPLREQRRELIRRWSNCIEPKMGAQYLLQILDHVKGKGPRPLAPWL